MKFDEKSRSAMSEGYWKLWNGDVMKKIDADIESNRKTTVSFSFGDLPAGAEVSIKQLSSSFVSGAHIFNFDRSGMDERNGKYKALYGTLFNSAAGLRGGNRVSYINSNGIGTERRISFGRISGRESGRSK